MAKFEVNDLTFTFAQSDDDTFIITNEQGLTFNNLDIFRDYGALVNIAGKTVSPSLPIGVLTKFVFPWYKPKVQLDMSEVKKYTFSK